MDKRILLIATGGTIASAPSKHGLSPQITPGDLLAGIVSSIENCTIDTIQIMNIDSVNLCPTHWLTMVQAIKDHYDEYDGFVITHGTDTMSYSAAALSYLIQNPSKPIVLTGAQVPLGNPISDAQRNLIDSFRFVSQEDAHGVFIVFSGRVIIGTRAKKLRTKSYDAFSSVNFPDYATIEGKRIIRYPVQYNEIGPVRFFDSIGQDVFLLKLTPSLDPQILGFLAEKYRAIVIECYGVGGVPFLNDRDFLREIAKIPTDKCVIVMATQAMFDGSDALLYEVGKDAVLKYGMLQSYDMTVEATMTKLMWLLGQKLGMEELKTKFYTPVSQDILIKPEY